VHTLIILLSVCSSSLVPVEFLTSTIVKPPGPNFAPRFARRTYICHTSMAFSVKVQVRFVVDLNRHECSWSLMFTISFNSATHLRLSKLLNVTCGSVKSQL
jgi:hypothetical protein